MSSVAAATARETNHKPQFVQN